MILIALHGFFRLWELVVKVHAHKVVQLAGLRDTEEEVDLTLPYSKQLLAQYSTCVGSMQGLCTVSFSCDHRLVQTIGDVSGPLFAHLGSLLLTWFNFNPDMDK